MDLADRIKIFINYLQIGSSKFADTCDIPRPTLSQILGGRNKKVSDEIIGKIHQKYPNLSVLWLMFGEGDMLVNENIQISEPLEGEIIDFSNTDSVINEAINTSAPSQKNVSDLESENFDNDIFSNIATAGQEKEPNKDESRPKSAPAADNNPVKLNFKNLSAVPSSENGGRRIVNIMVFYNDNSFETFTPAEG